MRSDIDREYSLPAVFRDDNETLRSSVPLGEPSQKTRLRFFGDVCGAFQIRLLVLHYNLALRLVARKIASSIVYCQIASQ